jgi:hypothetical protein
MFVFDKRLNENLLGPLDALGAEAGEGRVCDGFCQKKKRKTLVP